MDTHELRQFESVYKPSKEVAFCWLRKQYVQLSTEENHTEIVDHANYSLRIWQAAKAQAVTAQLDFNSILHDIDCYFDNGLSNTERTANNLLQSIYEKLSGEVKAQEPTND